MQDRSFFKNFTNFIANLSKLNFLTITRYNIFMMIFIRKNIGWLTIIALACAPIARWLSLAPWQQRFNDWGAVMISLGQITGLLGMVLFSINLILSGRFKILDRYFYGLNAVYSQHHNIGALAFSLLLFHPLFLAVNYLRASLYSAALFLLPSGNLPVTYGIIALGLMIILMVLTFYVKLKYQRWKFSHKFLVAVFIFAVLHTTYITSDISRDYPLRFYILGLAIIGLLSGLYRAVLSKYFNANFSYRIKEVLPLSQDVIAITMEPQGRQMEYGPGQFVFVSFKSSSVSSEIHPFSITSSPKEKELRLVVKALGDYTGELKKLRPQDEASIEGPFGKFSYKNMAGKNQVWIAGGVGITPFASMAKDLKAGEIKVDLYYCVGEKKEAVMLAELDRINDVNKDFKIILWCSDEKGRISGQIISDLSQGLADKDILLCGPPVFMKSLRQQFLKLNIPKSHIHWELFNLL